MPTDSDYPFDPTYGYDLDSLLKVGSPEGPADFADFWRLTYQEARAIAPNVGTRKIASPEKSIDLYEIEYDSFDGCRIGGWITIPADGHFECGTVLGHGYGGRGTPDLSLEPATVSIQPCIRWFDRSKRDGFPQGPHVLHGIETRETYSHRGSTADIWCAASALIELYPEIASTKPLHYRGGSFGGGIGALAMPWDSRFVRAFLDVPSFGNHPLRVTLPCSGSGESVRLRYQTNPEILAVLQYFDSATAARHIRIPTLAACALYDPAVPPPGQFAVYNAIACEKALFIRQAAHIPTMDGQEWYDCNARQREWFQS
jgi:cephalosporin-C deacetylase